MADRSFLTWPFFEDRHRALKHELDAFGAGLGELAHAEDDVDATCRALVGRLAESGLLRLSAELDVRSLCLARETLAYYGGLPDFAFAMQGLGSGAVSLFGTDAQKAGLLPRVVAGEAITGFALSEPEAGSDVAALATTARLDGDSYVLDGLKTWISNGGIADAYTVFARTGEAAGARGLSAFLVDADTPGLRIAERIDVDRPPSARDARLRRLPRARRSPDRRAGSGFKVAMATLDVFRSTVGAAALGFARRAFDETLARVSRASSSARPSPISSSYRGSSPTWRSRSTALRCSSTARRGRRTRRAAASPARQRWRSSTRPRPHSGSSTRPCSCTAAWA